MTWLSTILAAIPNLMGPLFTWLTSREQAARDEALAKINAWLAGLQTITQFKIVQFGWWGTRLLFFGFALGPLIHSLMLYLDSCGNILGLVTHVPGSWHIVAPPAPFDELEKLIILSFFATTVTGGVLKTVQQHLQLKHDTALIMADRAQFLPEQRMLAVRDRLTAQRTSIPGVSQTSTPPIIWIAVGIVVLIVLAYLAWLAATLFFVDVH